MERETLSRPTKTWYWLLWINEQRGTSMRVLGDSKLEYVERKMAEAPAEPGVRYEIVEEQVSMAEFDRLERNLQCVIERVKMIKQGIAF